MAMATPSTSYGDGSEAMDATLWGGLQNFIDLTMIYAKLPLDAFFRLRQVCQEWNRLASDRTFLEQSFKDPIPKPYFVVDSRKMGHRLLTCEIGRWNWTPLPLAKCEVAGLLCCEDVDSYRIFNVHTRVFHALPSLPEVRLPPLPVEEEEDYAEPLIGMTVDTSVSPYSFQVILGDEVIGTRIYDSKSDSWAHKPSTYEYSGDVQLNPSCAHCHGFLYIRVWSTYGEIFELHAYNFEKDEWDSEVPGLPEGVWECCDIGAWQDRLFVIGMNFGPPLVELAEDYSDYPWTLFDHMPEDMCSWMLVGVEDKLHHPEMVDIQSRFCGEYVLVYNYPGLKDVTERAALFNLDRKTWEKVELPGSCHLLSEAAHAEKDL